MRKWLKLLGPLYLSLIALVIFTYPISLVKKLVPMGRPGNVHAEFIEKIKQDLGTEKDIILLLGPYRVNFPNKSPAASILHGNSYYIFIDEEFFSELPDIEEKALIAHELGHILYTYPDNDKAAELQAQIGADAIAARYVSPEAITRLIRKNYAGRENLELIIRLEKIRDLSLSEY